MGGRRSAACRRPERASKEERMRKFLAGGLFLAMTLTVGIVANASGDVPSDPPVNTQTIEVVYKNNKAPKNKPVNLKQFSVETQATNAQDPEWKADAAVRARIDFPRNLSINVKKAAKCKENLETSDPRDVCPKKSIVSSPKSEANAFSGVPPTPKTALPTSEVVIVNCSAACSPAASSREANTSKKIKGTLVIWTNTNLGGGLIQNLPGTLSNAPGKKQGVRLDVTVPLLGLGSISLERLIGIVKGPNKFLTLQCIDKKMKTKSIFDFQNADSRKATSTSKCKRT